MKKKYKVLIAVIFLFFNSYIGYSQELTTGDCNWIPSSVGDAPLIINDTYASISVQFRDKNNNVSTVPPAPCDAGYAVRATIYWTTNSEDFKKITTRSWGSGISFLFNKAGKNYKTIYPCSMPSFDFVIGDGELNGGLATEKLKPNTTYYYKIYFYQWEQDGSFSKLIRLCYSPTYKFKTLAKYEKEDYRIIPEQPKFCGNDAVPTIKGFKDLTGNPTFKWYKSVNDGSTWIDINGQTNATYQPPKSDFSTSSGAATIIGPVTINYKREVNGNQSAIASITYFPSNSSFYTYLAYDKLLSKYTAKGSDVFLEFDIFISAQDKLNIPGASVKWQTSSTLLGDFTNTGDGVTGNELYNTSEDNNYYRAIISYGSCTSATTDVIKPSDIKNIKEVTIGKQDWTSQNIVQGNFADGTSIKEVNPPTNWASQTEPVYFKTDYGYLYNYNVINTNKNVCPAGWHVSTKQDWENLSAYYNNSSVGNKLATGTWNSGTLMPKPPKDNPFEALPGGYISSNNKYEGKNIEGAWWWEKRKSNGNIDSTGIRYIIYNSPNLSSLPSSSGGFHIRCVKNKL